jgi:hypothetical protein
MAGTPGAGDCMYPGNDAVGTVICRPLSICWMVTMSDAPAAAGGGAATGAGEPAAWGGAAVGAAGATVEGAGVVGLSM